MHDVESRALRRATVVLVCVCAARWGWDHLGGGPPVDASSVLSELAASVDSSVEEDARRSRPLAPGERIDPNRADAGELDRLPGIGPATAEAIARARAEGVVFARPEDLRAVSGIGPVLADRIAPHLDFRALAPGGRTERARTARAAPVDVNRAGADELQALPGIGPALAERIVARRRTRPFGSVDELIEVAGIGPATLERLRPRVTVGPPR